MSTRTADDTLSPEAAQEGWWHTLRRLAARDRYHERSWGWEIGLHLLRGERRWGVSYQEAARETGLRPKRLRTIVSVVRTLEVSRRQDTSGRDTLPFKVYEECQGLDQEAADELLALAEAKRLSARGVRRERRAREMRGARTALIASAPGELPAGVEVRHASAERLLADLKPGSVDAIITDPPYGRAWLPRCVDVARLAADALTPDGVLAIMLGGLGGEELDTITALRAHLPLRAVHYVVFDASNRLTKDWASGLRSQVKPVVVLGRGERKLPAVTNAIMVNETEKDLDPWQQSTEGFAALVERLTVPGALVVDCCCGAACTTGVACLRTGRRFIGGDSGERVVPVARARLVQEVAALSQAA